MVEPSMAVMDGLERAIVEPIPSAEVTKFAPPKYRGINAAALLAIHNDIRKTIGELMDHKRRLDEYSMALKTACDELQRSAG